MPVHPLLQAKLFKARAVLLAERLDLRALEQAERLAEAPLMLPAGSGLVALFRYGAVVLFDVQPLEETIFLKQLEPMLHGAHGRRETETLEIRITADAREGMAQQTLLLKAADIPRLQLVADILAKSVVLAEYEARIGAAFDNVEPLAAGMQQAGRAVHGASELLRHMGEALLSQHRMVGRVQAGEKPEALWEHPELEGLFLRLEDEFEIRERELAIERKLDVIARTAELLHDLQHTRQSLRVEWYIVILIVIEILLTLYEMFIRHHL